MSTYTGESLELKISNPPEVSNGAGISGRALNSLAIPAEVLRLLPAEFVRRSRVLPLEIRDGTLRVATAEPGNQRVIDDIRLLSGLEVDETSAPAPELMEKIDPIDPGMSRYWLLYLNCIYQSASK